MIRPRSKKREKLYAEHRRALVAKMLADSPVCQRCHRASSVDIHELKSRARGGSIIEPDNLVAVCRGCHNWITTHPKEAQETGWLKNSWD
jgi:5-methylcytosine-specific restriction endonuclease McrA